MFHTEQGRQVGVGQVSNLQLPGLDSRGHDGGQPVDAGPVGEEVRIRLVRLLNVLHHTVIHVLDGAAVGVLGRQAQHRLPVGRIAITPRSLAGHRFLHPLA